MAYRDYAHTKDIEFARFVWPAVEQCMTRELSRVDQRTGLLNDVDNRFAAEWTTPNGSVYVNSMLLGALSAANALATAVDVDECRVRFETASQKACVSFERMYWNMSGFYNYDSNGVHAGLVMAEQLTGVWYAMASGLSSPVDLNHVRRSLTAIFE